ncbi:hypothetical protein DL93DRAFT_2231733 [Clavulina sp. PMI_390]|nr:hypothetical protein DL93DRAFT_2231733 [Clavulina sp. PMI_390]
MEDPTRDARQRIADEWAEALKPLANVDRRAYEHLMSPFPVPSDSDPNMGIFMLKNKIIREAAWKACNQLAYLDISPSLPAHTFIMSNLYMPRFAELMLVPSLEVSTSGPEIRADLARHIKDLKSFWKDKILPFITMHASPRSNPFLGPRRDANDQTFWDYHQGLIMGMKVIVADHNSPALFAECCRLFGKIMRQIPRYKHITNMPDIWGLILEFLQALKLPGDPFPDLSKPFGCSSYQAFVKDVLSNSPHPSWKVPPEKEYLMRFEARLALEFMPDENTLISKLKVWEAEGVMSSSLQMVQAGQAQEPEYFSLPLKSQPRHNGGRNILLATAGSFARFGFLGPVIEFINNGGAFIAEIWSVGALPITFAHDPVEKAKLGNLALAFESIITILHSNLLVEEENLLSKQLLTIASRFVAMPEGRVPKAVVDAWVNVVKHPSVGGKLMKPEEFHSAVEHLANVDQHAYDVLFHPLAANEGGDVNKGLFILQNKIIQEAAWTAFYELSHLDVPRIPLDPQFVSQLHMAPSFYADLLIFPTLEVPKLSPKMRADLKTNIEDLKSFWKTRISSFITIYSSPKTNPDWTNPRKVYSSHLWEHYLAVIAVIKLVLVDHNSPARFTEFCGLLGMITRELQNDPSNPWASSIWGHILGALTSLRPSFDILADLFEPCGYASYGDFVKDVIALSPHDSWKLTPEEEWHIRSNGRLVCDFIPEHDANALMRLDVWDRHGFMGRSINLMRLTRTLDPKDLSFPCSSEPQYNIAGDVLLSTTSVLAKASYVASILEFFNSSGAFKIKEWSVLLCNISNSRDADTRERLGHLGPTFENVKNALARSANEQRNFTQQIRIIAKRLATLPKGRLPKEVIEEWKIVARDLRVEANASIVALPANAKIGNGLISGNAKNDERLND